MTAVTRVFLIAACLLFILVIGHGDHPDHDLHPLRALPGCAAYWQALAHSPQQSEEQLKLYQARHRVPSNSSHTNPSEAVNKKLRASVHRYLRTVVASTADVPQPRSASTSTSTYRTAASPRGMTNPHRHSATSSTDHQRPTKLSIDGRGGGGGGVKAPWIPLEPAPLSIIVLGTRDALHVGLGNLLMFLPAILHYAILTDRLVVIDDRSLLAQLCRLVVCKVPLISQLRHWLFTDTSATTTATTDGETTPSDLAAWFFHRRRYEHVLRTRHRWTATEFDVFFHPTHLDRYLWPLNGRDLKQLMYHVQSLHVERPLITLAGLDAQFNDWWLWWTPLTTATATASTTEDTTPPQQQEQEQEQEQLVAQCVAAYTQCDVTRVARGDIDCTDAAMYRFMFLLPSAVPPSPPQPQPPLNEPVSSWRGPWLRTNETSPRWTTEASSSSSSSWAQSLWTLPPPSPPLPPTATATATATAKGAVAFDRLNAENQWMATLFQRLEARWLLQHQTQPQPQQLLLRAHGTVGGGRPPPPPPTYVTAATAAFASHRLPLHRHLWTFPQPLRTCLLRPPMTSARNVTVATSAVACDDTATPIAMGIHLRNQFDFFEGEVSESDPRAQAELAAYAQHPERRAVFAAVLTEIHAQAQRWAQAAEAEAAAQTQTKTTQAAACFTVVLTADSVSVKLWLRQWLLHDTAAADDGDVDAGADGGADGGADAAEATKAATLHTLRDAIDRLLQPHSRCTYSDDSDGDGDGDDDVAMAAVYQPHANLSSVLAAHVERHRRVHGPPPQPSQPQPSQPQPSQPQRRYRRERWMAVAFVDPAETAPQSAFHVKAADHVVHHVDDGLRWPVLDWLLLSHVERLVVWRRQHSASVSTFALAAHRLAVARAAAFSSFSSSSSVRPSAVMLVQPRHGSQAHRLVAVPVVSITRDKYHLPLGP